MIKDVGEFIQRVLWKRERERERVLVILCEFAVFGT